MAKLYFRYGAMGSSKTANAIMVRYNYMERGQTALMLKPRMESRDGVKQVRSRSGLTAPCEYIEDIDSIDVTQYNCLIVDEAQFLTREQVEKLVKIVDEKDVPVICYGLRADFKGELFPGSLYLMAWADAIEEVKTVCWCGRKATFNARIQDGKVVRTGEQIVLGGNESYVSLCRKHWAQGLLGGRGIRRIESGFDQYRDMLSSAQPDAGQLARDLERGEMFLLSEGGDALAEAVAVREKEDLIRLASLATREAYRMTGCARSLIGHIRALYPKTRITATAPEHLAAFFEKVGFVYDRQVNECPNCADPASNSMLCFACLPAEDEA